MRMNRTSFALEEIDAFIAQSGSNSLVESYFVQYLLIAFYSEVEENVKKIIQQRVSSIEDQRVAYFINVSYESFIKRIRKAEINDVLKKFNCGEGDIISVLTNGENLQPYFDAITNRHLVSHGDGAQMTLVEFRKAVPCAERILEVLEAALSA